MRVSQAPRRRRRGTGACRNERGAALIIVLIALVGLTALAAAGMVITESDLRVSENVDASATAFYVADAGLQEYMGTNHTGEDTATYAYGGGTATVTGEKLLDLPGGRSLHRITSTSTYAPPGGGTASRTLSLAAIYGTGSISVKGAFTSASGLLKNGGAGELDGTDQYTGGNPKCGSSKAPVAGVKVPPGGYTQMGGQLVPEGDPPIDDTQGGVDLLDATTIDWDGIVNGGLISPDYTIPPDSWPNFGGIGPDEWPVIYVDGNYTVTPSESGHGTLIVRDNLAMNGSFQWDGVILVGGYVTSNGYQIVDGGTVSGLNLSLNESVATSDIGNGNKKFRYHSCNLLLASKAAFGGLSQVPGSWKEVM